ncbi:hypothetical protein ACJVQT_23005 [Enterobacter huaxiensis]|uniref:hypothetical protein n=1 Tax=Enterobacter huaxiensis TaxID=2494702 RepID=UPI002175A201|nr:hypothetical protein [Enterobacter huaxiensis]MCS5452536.1 hypothetical protein [Enterobacter huaxiensis]
MKRLHPNLPKLDRKIAKALRKEPTDQDVIYDTIEVANTVTIILLGALIEPDRDGEKWTRQQIRQILSEAKLKRWRTYEILRSAQLKPSAFEWLKYYFNKLQLTKAPNGGHLHGGVIVNVDYESEIESNL